MEEEVLDTPEEAIETEGVEESGEQGTPPAAPTAKQEASKPQTTIIEIDGKKYQATQEDLLNLAKRGIKFDQRAKTAGDLEKQLQEMQEKLKNADAFQMLKDRGMSPQQIKAWMEQQYEELLKEETMTPEEREYRELKKFKEQEQKNAKEREEREKQEKQKAAIHAEQQRITQELADALKESTLPKHPFMGKMALQEMLAAQAHGHQISVKEAVKLAEFTVRNQLSEFVQQMDAKTLSELLGEKRVRELRGLSVAGVKSGQGLLKASPLPNNNTGTMQMNQKESKPVNMNEFFKSLATKK